MRKTLSLLLLAAAFSGEHSARVFAAGYGDGISPDQSGLSTPNGPQFAVCRVAVAQHAVDYYDSDIPTSDLVFEGMITSQREVVITNYAYFTWTGGSLFTNGDEYSSDLARNFTYGGGFYSGSELADQVNAYMEGEPLPDHVTISEQHNGSSFHVTYDKMSYGGTNLWETLHLEVSRTYDGAVLPTRNLKQGRDKGPICTNCPDCSDTGMPVWSISEPYLNVWLHDTPVFYRTSLGREIGFELNYKQRDTRPKDDGFLPTTGWNHNWYSYVHFDIPVMASPSDGTNTDIVRASARGWLVRANWVLTNDYSNWDAILYAPDSSESYFLGGNRDDAQSGCHLVPLYGGGSIMGFRAVYEDGSQDLYTGIKGPKTTYGIVERYGCVFDKQDLSSGMAGVWRLPLGGAASPHQLWQDGDDAANYGDLSADSSSIQQCDINNDPSPPDTAIEYQAYDALLTARVDPYGNLITLNYTNAGGRDYLSSIVDYDGQRTDLHYNALGCLDAVTMPYGRAASFAYDGDGTLSSITDAQGMTSYMTYEPTDSGTNQHLISLSTLYGTTRFDYYDENPYLLVHRPSYLMCETGSTDTQVVNDTNTVPVYAGEYQVNHSITVTHPDGSQEFYLYYGTTNTHQLSPTLPPGSTLAQANYNLDYGQAGGEGSLLYRNVFHWGRAQTPLLSQPASANLALASLTTNDFAVATMHHYLAEDAGSSDMDISPSASLLREPSSDGQQAGNITWFTYPNQGEAVWQIEGEALDSTQITQAPDGTPLVTIRTHDGLGNLTGLTKTFTQPDGSSGSRGYTWYYSQIPFGGENGLDWYLPVLTGRSGPGGPIWTLSDPETNVVQGVTALNWPVVQATDAVGNISTFFYNARHQRTGARYANGLTVTNLYDGNGFLQESIALEAQATNTFTFANGELASQTTPLGLTLSYTHDLLGRLTGVLFPDGTSVAKVYSRLDLVGEKDRSGAWSLASYDSMDQLRTLTWHTNAITQYSYCLCGGLESVIDPTGSTTTYLRNNLGQVTNIVSAEGSTSIERDNLGRRVHETSTYGLDLAYGYNYQGLMTGVTNPAGTVRAVVYDYQDRPIWDTDAQGNSITNAFDNLGRLQYRWNAFGLVEENGYSAQGLSQHYDALRNLTAYGYDAAGRVASVTNANLEVVRAGRDPAGHILSLTDGRNHSKQWRYDIYGRRIAEFNAHGMLVKTNGYDANGRLAAQWTAAKGLTQLGYDSDGNLVTISYPHSILHYTYDLLDRLTGMSDGVGDTTFGYANLGAFKWALGSEAGPWSGTTVSYGYSGPLRSSLSINSQLLSTINYDLALRPQGITSPAGTFTYAFNGAGRQLASLLMPGSTTTLGYDEAGELDAIQVMNAAQSVVDYHGYDYDLNGFITGAHRLAGINNPQSTINYSYGYDNIGQLISAQAFEPNSTLRKNENLGYRYDASGNLAWRTNNTLLQAFTSDNLNQLASITRSGTLTAAGSLTGAVTTLGVNGKMAEIYSDQTFATTEGLTLREASNVFVTAGSNVLGELVASTITSNLLPVTVNFTYDFNGNLLSDGQRVFAYDDANQLTGVFVPGQWKTEFLYDGLGRRRITREYTNSLGSWSLASETRLVSDGMLPVQERDANNNVLVTYTRGLDLSGSFQGAGGIGGLLARTDGNGSAFYHSDPGGNITALTDSSGNAVARYVYDPFGRLLGKWGPLAEANRYRFSSKEVDSLSGLYYYGFRFFDSNLQRWLNQDPMGEAGGINLYGFVGNSPPNSVDATGLDFWDYIPGVGVARRQQQGDAAIQAMLAAKGYGSMDEYNLDHPIPGSGTLTKGGLEAAQVGANLWSGSTELYLQAGQQIAMAGIVTKGTQAAAQGIADAAEQGWLSKLWSKCKAPFKRSPTGLSAGARTEAKSLAEQLALQEAQAGAGTRIMQGAINDPSFPEDVWAKMQWVHDNPDGSSITIHYWQNLQTGQSIGLKFKNP